MGDAIFYFVLLLMLAIGIVNLVLTISSSMLLIKTYEIIRQSEERRILEIEAKNAAKGLVDISTPQVPYSLT